jgi:hypothetical protein
MTDSNKVQFPLFSGYEAGHKLAQPGEMADVGQFKDVCEAIFDNKGVLEVVTGSTVQWRARSDDQDEACTALYPSLLLRLRGRAARAAKKAPRKNLRAAYLAALESGQAKTIGKRSTVIQAWLGGAYEEDSDGEIDEFVDEKTSTLEEKLNNEITVEELLKISILTNLPPHYDGVCTSLLADDNVDMAHVSKRLSEHQIQHRAKTQDDTAVLNVARGGAHPSAASASSSCPPSGGGQPQDSKIQSTIAKACNAAVKQAMAQANIAGGGGWPAQKWTQVKKAQNRDWCAYCKSWGHTVSKCWKKNGKPGQGKGTGKGGFGKGGKGGKFRGGK